jgi:hypothetical protein
MQPQRTRPQHLRRQQRIHVLKYQTRENFQLACVPGRFGVENVLVGVYEVVYEASLVAETWTVGERWARDLRAWGHVPRCSRGGLWRESRGSRGGRG